jgi:hypothetical protein
LSRTLRARNAILATAHAALGHGGPLAQECRRTSLEVVRAQDEARAHGAHLPGVCHAELELLPQVRAALHVRKLEIHVGGRRLAVGGAERLQEAEAVGVVAAPLAALARAAHRDDARHRRAAHQAARVAQRVVALGERAIGLVGGFHRDGHAEMGHGRMVRRPVTIP